MDKAKQAVSSFLSKDGKHDTTVHETVNPAVTNEHVTRTQHEDAQRVIDREVHQDHYHTSVQPVKDREVLPEQHTHNQAAVENREIKHGDDSHIRQRLEQEQGQFRSTREVGDVRTTQSQGRDVVGEHIHHHVHENIQPVIQKETVQPSVVHTTIPVHEVHHNEAKHHTASALPAMSIDEFKHNGGTLSGREERRDQFAGEPKSVGGTLGGRGAAGTTSLTERIGYRGRRHHQRTNSNSSYSSSSDDDEIRRNKGSKIGGYANRSRRSKNPLSSSNRGYDANTSSTGNPSNPTGTYNDTSVGKTSGLGSNHGPNAALNNRGTTAGTNQHTTHDTKPSLLDKLNPKKDADGDGKPGFMK